MIAGAPQKIGFGSEIARRSTEQLGGTLVYDWQPDGLRIAIDLPRARLA
jgi:two-component sensor histidine kinase